MPILSRRSATVLECVNAAFLRHLVHPTTSLVTKVEPLDRASGRARLTVNVNVNVLKSYLLKDLPARKNSVRKHVVQRLPIDQLFDNLQTAGLLVNGALELVPMYNSNEDLDYSKMLVARLAQFEVFEEAFQIDSIIDVTVSVSALSNSPTFYGTGAVLQTVLTGNRLLTAKTKSCYQKADRLFINPSSTVRKSDGIGAYDRLFSANVETKLTETGFDVKLPSIDNFRNLEIAMTNGQGKGITAYLDYGFGSGGRFNLVVHEDLSDGTEVTASYVIPAESTLRFYSDLSGYGITVQGAPNASNDYVSHAVADGHVSIFPEGFFFGISGNVAGDIGLQYIDIAQISLIQA